MTRNPGAARHAVSHTSTKRLVEKGDQRCQQRSD